MVNVQKHLIDYSGIDQLLSVAGGSMGGNASLGITTANSLSKRLKSAIVTATAAKHSPQQIAFHEVGRHKAIMAHSHWKDGHYYGWGHLPAKGSPSLV